MRKAVWMILYVASGYAVSSPLACLIEAEKSADLGAPGVGVIKRIAVERGDFVVKGQVLAYLKADVEQAAKGVAQARSQAQAEVNASEAAYDLAQIKLSRARQLQAVGFVSQEAVEQAEAEARVAQHRVLQAQEGQTVSIREYALSNSQLAQRTIRSPFAGMVTERYRTEGERVEREPLVRVAKMDPLRVEVIMPAAEFGQIKKGALAAIKTTIPGVENLKASVVLVDPFIDAASNSFRVRLTLPNPNYRIPAGLRCNADFSDGGASAGASRPSVPPKAALSGKQTALGRDATAKIP